MNAKGFTLIEIMIVLAILGVLAGLAGMSYSAASDGYALTSGAEQLAQQLKNARTEALARNTAVEFAAADGGFYTIRVVGGAVLSGRIVLGRAAVDLSLTFEHLNGAAVRFDRWGAVQNASGGTPALTLVKGTGRRTVTVEIATGYVH
ncbi:prepilin-type N-terminal cleavage/methylation domain-containing protein [Hydrogenispora ethanolica]|uniref:Prepilin-type N-terminal cleavage/methylation domain-containing protein n=1 Tax=Hydrogenispora ethanolica TaxID=1082276 RepID=A0A4R1S2C2_HYDET|nr:prepilin-type N-terminal cleavage/methylation domain-containing protein [Hydrogenispora ethanolica]TCL73335.1 prepilin-type N-terminal cleavage/methylation domain-containing protein [Hydrogenispora ethanolica]